MKKPGIETLLTHYGEERTDHKGAVVPPIYQNSLFTFKDWDAIENAFDDRTNSCIYTRGNNPTVQIAEQKIAKLAGGERAKLFASGMAAISSAILHYVSPGDHIIAVNNIYGPAHNFLLKYLSMKMNITTTFVEGNELSDFENALTSKTSLIYIESPSSTVFTLQDVGGVANLAKSRGIKTIIDNTWATPIFQRPLAMGIDLEVHSCSKYIAGHSDVVAGVVIGSEKEIAEIYVNEFELLGGKMTPFEAWLITRSLRTLPMRMERHQANAIAVAEFLNEHPKIRKVNYPGLGTDPQHDLAQKQMSGYSGLLSFTLDCNDLEQIKTFFNSMKYFQIGVSWGGHESLIYAPAISYWKEHSPEQFKAMRISVGDIRISVGLETIDDLIDDLKQGLSLLA